MGALSLKTAIRRRVSGAASQTPWAPDAPRACVAPLSAREANSGRVPSPGDGSTQPPLPPTRPPARIGPNTLIQTFAAIAEFEGEERAGGLRVLLNPPEDLDGMIDEAHFVRLVRSLRRILPPASVDRILERAGARTADYVLHNRIPAPARFLLPRLPRKVALPLVLAAFRRNAWTFAGSGHYRAIEAGAARDEPHIELDGCITCVGAPGGRPGGAFYRGAFQGLLSALVAPGIRVTEDECVATGGRTCQYTIHLPGRLHREVSIHITTPEVQPCV
jgi:divinyl protochlorophyllide a 8-vinyl-reductase